jgi:hypothetical protein
MATTLPLVLTAKQLLSLESSSQLFGFVTNCLRTLLLPMSEWRCIMRIKPTNLKDIPASNKREKTAEHKVLDLPTQFEANDFLSVYFDGMGEGTARILINRRLNERLLKKYGVEDLKNIGRYYSAKIIGSNGELVDEVLVDKQCGVIASLRKKLE